MSSITNVNNNSSVVNVGRTTPVSPGIQPAAKSIPVVIASDQTAIPVAEQNKVQSEVALSLLGIPRAEVALGIFADVNTYDVNPSEWSSNPQYHVAGHGIKHLPNEAGALVEAPRNKTAVLTSKRFFRYQPGRVSAATFGVKSTVSQADYAQNPAIRKFGIYDNFDGYFWETRNNGEEDNFSVVRRSQSLIKNPNSPYGNVGLSYRGNLASGRGSVSIAQNDDYRIIGLGESEAGTLANLLPKDRELVQNTRFTIITAALTAAGVNYTTLANAINAVSGFSGETAASVEAKCVRDLDFWIDFYLLDMQWGGDGHTRTNTTNYITAALPAIATYERPVHAALRTQLLAVSGLSTAGTNKITALTAITTAAFAGSTIATQMSGATYGTRDKFETIMMTKSHYWAYVVSKKTELGAVINYAAYSAGLGQALGLTAEDILYKCQRDVGYIIHGYANDIIGGGNAETKFNMSMYFKGNGMSIYSQISGSTLAETERHTHLKNLIRSELAGDVGTNYGFGYSAASSELVKLNTLATKVINNFQIEDLNSMETGTKAFAGNLTVVRDGLIVTHAAVFDPSLLKEQKKIPTVSSTANQLKLTEGHVTFGQHVKVSWTGTAGTIGTLANNTIYKVKRVYGPKGNEFALVNEAGTAQTFTVANTTTNVTGLYVCTVVPFIMPADYNPTVWRGTGSSSIGGTNGNTYTGVNGQAFLNINADGSEDGKLPKGMVFPYMYASDQNLNSSAAESLRVGFINTAIDVSTNTGTATNPDGGLSRLRSQIDNVNFVPEYVNWIKNNVKPEFWGVYDYRVPRSRFSHDALDGKSKTNADVDKRVYSDLATGETGTVRPGQQVILAGETLAESIVSLYDFDFTKVTMLKIEFSWYGAVGALFLAYVPVSNGEARWVRVHHLRASNQYKTASLGNATLPITYTTYGGGDQYSLGDGEDVSPIDMGYNSNSHSVVKYGSSYYIDGGDRGTVRLYSHNNEDTTEAYGKRWSVSGSITTQTLDGVSTPAIAVNNSTLTEPTGISNVSPTYFQGARLKTGNKTDQNIKVIWANDDYVFLSSTPQGTGFILIPDRAVNVFGLETKKVILSTREGNAVRNRVQVYPTKLSSSNISNNPVRLRMKKTPTFQTSTAVTGTLSLSANYVIDANNAPLAVTESGTYMANGQEIYGWFRATVGVDRVTVFGRLYKLSDSYYFEILETFNGTITINATENFLPDGRYQVDGTTIAAAVVTKSTTEKEGLSSIVISSDTVVPIPNTGTNVATIYLQQGTEQLDLSPYFDYNKEYLSFPLTDQADSLYFAVDSDTGAESAVDEISLGCTWEEQ